jgi:hypothetical protein
MADFYLGLDLGQAQDYTALTIVELVDSAKEAQFHVRHLERFALRTPYPAIAARVATMIDRPPLAGCTTVVVDATGVGRPVVDMMRRANISPVAVTITGGDSVSHDCGEYRVPKRDLVAIMQVLLQTERLKIAAEIPEAALLQNELLNFQVKINLATAHDSYGAWREGTHDDLVLATAMACWYAERCGQGLISVSHDDDDDET